MKWILCGKNDAAVACLEHLVERGDEVLVVATRHDAGEDGWQRSLRRRAGELGVASLQPARINAPECVERLAGFGPRALLSIQYDQILRGPLFRALRAPSLNLHFALLPRHRGVAPIAWAILEGDAWAGVTLHHMVEEIDAGDVVDRERVPVGPEQTARELYDAVSGAAVSLFQRSYPFPEALLARRLAQDGAGACYHASGELDFSALRTDWSRPAPELARWLRAMIFPPLQLPETSLGGRRLQVTRAADAGAAAGAAPGTVLACGGRAARVACGAGCVELLGLRDPARPAACARELLAGVQAGDRFE